MTSVADLYSKRVSQRRKRGSIRPKSAIDNGSLMSQKYSGILPVDTSVN
jgi:hypothetical protein